MPRGLKTTTVIKKGGKGAIKLVKSQLKRPSRKLYTDSEKKELSRLRTQNRYYRKRITAESKKTPMKYTLAAYRDKIPDKGSESLAAQLHAKGYFDEPDYSSRDFREWMLSNDDSLLLSATINEINLNIDDEKAQISNDPDFNQKVADYNEKIRQNENKISAIKQLAGERKADEQLKYMNKKMLLSTGDDLLTAMSKGKIIMDDLSDPEKAAIRHLKNGMVKGIFKAIPFDKMPEEYRPVVKRAIYASMMEDPVQGMRDAIRGVASVEAAKKYGMAGAEFASGVADTLTSVLTGKPNIKPLLKGGFNAMITKSPLNKSLMSELANDAIESGTSTNDKENAKMLGRDIAVDIVKDVIASGGNLLAAIPMVAKDILVDSVQAGVRKVKYDAKEEKKNEAARKSKEKAEKQKEKEKAAKKLTEDKTEAMSEEELERLYSKFEAK